MLIYDEVFVSIQGESRDMGKPCIFVRLFGCPFKCAYCDQPQKNGKKISIERLMSMVYNLKRQTGVKEVCVTGGEPLIQPETMPLVYEMQQEYGFNVSIETSGCVAIERTSYNRSYRYIMDVKCPSSGGVENKNVYDNLIHLHQKDDVVFVIRDEADYNFMRKILKTYQTRAQVLVSPMFNENNEMLIGQELVDWLLRDKLSGVRVQMQMHKFLGVR